MSDKIGGKNKESRAEKLRELGKELEYNYEKRFVGKKVEVLIEKVVDGKYIGKTENYLNVEFSENMTTRKKDKLHTKNIVCIEL